MKIKSNSKITVTELTTKYKATFRDFDSGAVLMLKERVPSNEREYDEVKLEWIITKVQRNLQALKDIAYEYFECGEFITHAKAGLIYYDLKTMIPLAEQPGLDGLKFKA